MFKVFYKLAARFGRTDRTYVGDIFVATVFGYCMAMHLAPDGHQTLLRGLGGIDHAKALAVEAQQTGLARWLAVTSTHELDYHLRITYGALQKTTGTRRADVEKLYAAIVEELAARARGETVFA